MMMMDEGEDKYLIKLVDSKQQDKLQLIQEKLSNFPKYFFNSRSNTLLIYDRTCVFIVSKQQTKVTDLGKVYPIVQMAYNTTKNILIFFTSDGVLFGHFISHKTQLIIKKDIKKQILFDWVYGREQFDFFIADSAAVKLFKIQDEKKSFKQIKSISGKFNSFLYDPLSQVLVAFPQGDCRLIYSFFFDEDNKNRSWFKGPQIAIDFYQDENLKMLVKKNKSLGLHNSRIHEQLFMKRPIEDYAAELLRMNRMSYLLLYFGNQGKLKLYPITDEPYEKEVSIKLPSDSLPIFNVIDNMLVIHLKNEKITFIYDINGGNSQMLVSPFPIQHSTRKNINPYEGYFYGKRHILPNGVISKWQLKINVIHCYLKNEVLIFDFLLKREKAKNQMLGWLRQNLLKIKQLNLSKFWKLIFSKCCSPLFGEKQVITIIEIYANIFYTLVHDEMMSKEPILHIILQCVRQAIQFKIKIPFELQKLIFDLLLMTRKYETLVFLCHNDVIKDNEEFAEALQKKGVKENEEVLLTLSIDMANRVCRHQKVFELLILSQKVWEARRYLKQNYENIEVIFMIYVSKGIRDAKLREEYMVLTRQFVLKKFPSITEKYIDEAEEYIRNESEIIRQSVSVK